MNHKKFAFDHPDAAMTALATRLANTARTSGASGDALPSDPLGRVLAADITADRNSPAADVSAMDGYGIRLSDLQAQTPLSIEAESACGSAPPSMPTRGVLRIFTGAMVPQGCDLVIKREDTIEREHEIELTDSVRQLDAGANIRRMGENLRAGQTVMTAGTLIDSATRAAMVNFGAYEVDVYQPVRVAIITTGEELVAPHQSRLQSPEQSPEPWQLHNSNQFGVAALLSQTWIEVTDRDHVGDHVAQTEQLLRERLQTCDAVIMTGGVSMGDYDFVPEVVQKVGGQIAFHGLPIRPGKPILGASTASGKLIIGLPGNPVSAMVNTKRIVVPLLAKMSGQTQWMPKAPAVLVDDLHESNLPLHRYLLANLQTDGTCRLVPSKGSGDLVALGQSDGFVEIPIGSDPASPKAFFGW